MIDYYEKEDFGRTVFYVDDGKVVEETLEDVCLKFAKETTAPVGVVDKIHTRGNQLWTWGAGGQHPAVITEFEDEDEAWHACLLAHRYDLYNQDDTPTVFDTRQEAEAYVRELDTEDV